MVQQIFTMMYDKNSTVDIRYNDWELAHNGYGMVPYRKTPNTAYK
jgi:hypothetical protein